MEQNHYELLYIVSIKYIEADLQRVREAVNKIITDNGGVITLDEILSKQRLAYPIKHIHQGTYVVVEFNTAPESLKAIDSTIEVMPEVLRHLTVVAKQRTAEEIEQDKKLAAAIEAEQLSKQQAYEARNGMQSSSTHAAAPAPKAVEPEAKEDAVVKEKIEKPKASIEELDKKLDELLTEEVL